MEHRYSSIAVWKTAAVVIAVAVAVSMAGGALAATPPSEIKVRNQDLNTGVIILDSVTAPQDGWVVIYKSPAFNTGDIVGFAPVHQGVNNNVKVTIDTKKVGDLPTLWARLHTDNAVKGLFEWGWRGRPYNDPPVVENGHQIVTGFGTWATQGNPSAAPATPAAPAALAALATPATPAAPTTPAASAPVTSTNVAGSGNAMIDITTQPLNTGVMHVNSVTSPQNGWVVVYKDPNFTSGEIVGVAPVKKGANTNVPVTIDTGRVKDLGGLWIMLQADNGVPGLFEWGLRNQPYNDQPIVQNGHPVMTGFGITAVPQ